MNSWPVSAYREGDIEELKFLISNKSWWDTVDLIASNYLGKYALKFPEMMDQVIMEWQDEKSIWLHRSCIIYQLKYKSSTNLERLSYLIGVYKSNNAFFIQKSIGWSLREVSKWNPEWVKTIVENKELAGLAKREAMKYIAKK
jgi:3-methyladenine DNA glycosylase AlkD